jgi:CheY-like chemotaxis protein
MTINRAIIAVDDDADDIELLQEAFADNAESAALTSLCGADAFLAYMFGPDFNHKCLINAAPQVVPEIILLDVNMPKVGGIKLVQLIRANIHLADCKIVMLTTSVNPKDKLNCSQAGADLYLVKPSSFTELVSLCAVLLNEVLLIPRSAMPEVMHAV